MSLTDKKVSDALLQTGVVSAPDRLTGTAAENKAVFDRLMRNVAQSVINPVIDELVGIEGADNIGTPEGSVRQRLDSASDHIGNRENPHNVTPAQIGAETPMEAQNKVNEALSQAKQYAETEIRKHIAQSGAVIADGKGNAENANALNGIPGENYLPEKITDLTGAKSYEYAAPMACVARPSFIGRTVQEGTPGPDSPTPIRGVLNPWIKATAEDGTVVTKQLTGELFDGDSFDGANLVRTVKDWKITGGSCKWNTTIWATSPEIIAFGAYLPTDFSTSPTVVMCDRFTLWGTNDTETIQPQGINGLVYLFIKKSRLSDSFDTLVENEKVAALENWLNEKPIHLLYELNAPVVTRHDMDLQLSPGNWTIEAGDENGLLESVSIEVLPNSAVYGRRVYPYQHTKAGNVHKLTGTPGAEQIIFRTTGAYQDGDTWTLNGAAVAVTYNDGQKLLPTAVIAGDVVEAVIEGGVLRLMLQKLTPAENLLINGDFKVNQRGQNSYSGTYIYTVDRYMISNGTLTLVNGGVELDPGSAYSLDFYEHFNNKDIWAGKLFTLSAEIDSKLYTFTSKFDGSRTRFDWGELWLAAFSNNPNDLRTLPIIKPQRKVVVSRVKLEEGPRFTGWYEPKPGETLAECQRYQAQIPAYAVSFGAEVGGRCVSSAIVLPQEMRITPVCTFSILNVSYIVAVPYDETKMKTILDGSRTSFCVDVFDPELVRQIANRTVIVAGIFADANI